MANQLLDVKGLETQFKTPEGIIAHSGHVAHRIRSMPHSKKG